MRIEKLFLHRVQDVPADVKTTGHRLMLRGGYAHQTAAGIYTLSSIGLKACRNIMEIIRQELDSFGCQEVSMPVLSPEALWKETGRDNIDILLKIKTHSGTDMVLNLSHEEVVVDYARGALQSYRQLPLMLYQFQTKYRDELRPRAGLIRCREFTMKDAYSFNADEKSLDETYERFRSAYFTIFEKAGLKGVFDVKASGGDMADEYSHEFQWISEVGEDFFYICDKCGFRANKEILTGGDKDAPDVSVCSECGDKLEKKRGVEVGNIFRQGQKFTGPMKMRFSDRDGTEKTPFMGAYGIGIGRLFGCILESSGEEGRAVFNLAVAPYKVHVIALGDTAAEAEKLYDTLTRAGVEAIIDATDARAGSKFADADLLGAPIRAILSDKNIAAGIVEMKYSGIDRVLPESLPLSTAAEKIIEMIE
ncbi:MAG: hypothetical protein LBL52_01495 [Rickettsiales bacterium]|jgi:prolyl-tRNA synthetase|nr:hypothetical protein [Rickettsiales bacterium]